MYEPNGDQRRILRWEDHIVPILEHPDISIRSKALVAVAWESCALASELGQLRYGDVEDLGDRMTILITGPKDHDRKLTLYGSMPYLKKWVREGHPVTEAFTADADPLEEADPSTPLWTEKLSNKQLLPLLVLNIPEEVCKKAGVTRKVTLHDIRHSRVKLLASKHGLDPSILRARFGWCENEYRDLAEPVEGECLDEEIKPSAPVRCPNCGAWAPRHQPCLWCGVNR